MKLPTHHGSFSPDGRWRLYSALEKGRWDAFVRPVPPAVLGITGTRAAAPFSAVQISSAGGVQPLWRSDGKEIFYLARSGMMMAVPVEIGEAAVRPGAPVALFPTSLGMLISFSREYEVSADGKRFLMPVPALDMQVDTPITVIVNWPRLLEKK